MTDTELLILRDECERLQLEVESYKEQRETDVAEIGRLESQIEEMHDWEGKAIDQMQRVIWSWDNEIDANIINELEKLSDLVADGLVLVGE